MSVHHYLFIGLLSVLFLFRRTRYASFVYLVPYFIYLYAYANGWIPEGRYHAISATLNTFIGVLLFKGYEYNGLGKVLNLHKYNVNQKVGLLSFLLVFVNLIGYWRYENNLDATIYNSDYRFIVAIQISLLYIGNMINAWVDRRDHKLALVCFADSGHFEAFDEELKKEVEREK